ncbi:RNA polymerase sigma factor [Kutzneria sp. NPDC052558]|uniref:RNA polymerase sigma factor n=1 Tax=Kutzneria sp. NPDC052558 TaxID=3364121 RepID=UPI0037CC3EB0
MSFEEFFREAYPRMMARAVLLCGDRADAEDAVAQAFAEVFRRWDTASRYDAPEAYLHVTMTRKALRLVKRRRLEEMRALELPVSPYATPHEALAAKEVLAAVAGLPPMQRAVLVHCCLDGMKQAEVAKLLRIQRGTVAAHLFKAREALSAKLGLGARTPDDGLVGVVRRDQIADSLQVAQRWLAEGFAADERARARVRTAVDQVKPPRRRWGRG